MLKGKRILLVVAGGIAAFKSQELVRLLRKREASVRCVLTEAGAKFVTPLSLQALTEDKVYSDLFSLTDESEMGHIQLSRDADLLVVAPATANILARMAAGLADDLASTVLLATDKPVLAAPAMNVRMWTHAATVANVETLQKRGIHFVGPNDGVMACNEYGPGRMSEPEEIVAAIEGLLADGSEKPMAGKRALVTVGPDARGDRSGALHLQPFLGQAGPCHRRGPGAARRRGHPGERAGEVPDPAGVKVVKIDSADQMLAACLAAGKVDVAVCAAAVADWKMAKPATAKIKKKPGAAPPALELTPNPDILATLSKRGPQRPTLVVGFAAETENLVANAIEKRTRKGCDWIVANDVSPATGTFGGERNTVHLITAEGVQAWPTLQKDKVAMQLAGAIALHLTRPRPAEAAE